MNLYSETGRPKFDGRYVAYVEGVLGWLEPHIIVWTKNGWHHLHSTSEYEDEVLFWYGPLPVMSRAAWDAQFTPAEDTQWSPEEIAAMGANPKPALEINRLSPLPPAPPLAFDL